jgi:PAS domain S-box-containing protein
MGPRRPLTRYVDTYRAKKKGMLRGASTLDGYTIEQRVCIMPPHSHFGFDTDRFCWKLIHEGPDAVVFADFGGLIRFWNQGAERIFGYSAKEAIGMSLDLIMPENLRARHWAAYGETMRTGKTRYGDGEVLTVPALAKGGRLISIEFSMFPYRDTHGSLLGVGAILRDVTKRIEEMKALRGAASAQQATSSPAEIPR